MSAVTDPEIVSDEDRLRADLYNFLGLILSAPAPDMLLAQTAGLSGCLLYTSPSPRD